MRYSSSNVINSKTKENQHKKHLCGSSFVVNLKVFPNKTLQFYLTREVYILNN